MTLQCYTGTFGNYVLNQLVIAFYKFKRTSHTSSVCYQNAKFNNTHIYFKEVSSLSLNKVSALKSFSFSQFGTHILSSRKEYQHAFRIILHDREIFSIILRNFSEQIFFKITLQKKFNKLFETYIKNVFA